MTPRESVKIEVLPEAVRCVLEQLKREHKYHLEIHKRDDGYYVSESARYWDDEKHRNVKVGLYLGKITNDGKLEPPIRKRLATEGVKNLEEYIRQRKTAKRYEEKGIFESRLEPEILKMLSTNPRDGISRISDELGKPYPTTHNWVRKLEKRYDIKYTLDYGFLDRFHLYRFFAMAKFTGSRPDANEIKKLLASEPRIQLALWTRGSYDLLIFILASTPIEAEEIIYGLRSNLTFSKHVGFWYSSYYTQGYGYIPLRNEFFDLIKDRIWQRTKETPRRQLGQLFKREYAIMKELNADGLASFTSIDEKYNLKRGSAQYTYYSMLEQKQIHRVTMLMNNPPVKGIAVILLQQLNIGKFNKTRKNYFLNIIQETNKPLNKFIFTGDIGAPYGLLLIAPLYQEGDLEKLEEELRINVKGVKIKSSILSETLIGNLGFRKIDNPHTRSYEILTKEYGIL